MSHPLHLTTDEQKLFAKLPEKLKEGWEVKTEKLKSTDTPERRDIRMQITHFHSPSLKEMATKAKKVNSKESFAEFLADFDLNTIDDKELTSVFFILGPDVISTLISLAVRTVDTDEGLTMIAALARLRHIILSSYATSQS